MTNPNKTEIMMIMDASGSMESMRSSVVNSFNEFIQDQKKIEGDCSASLVFFNTFYNPQYISTPISEVMELTYEDYLPNGCTALNDAIGKSLNDLGAKLSSLSEDERPANIIVCIFTDGEENASKEFSNAQIKEMIKHQEEKYNWQFIFVGTDNLDVEEMGNFRGILASNTYTMNNGDFYDMMKDISIVASSYRAGDIDSVADGLTNIKSSN